MFFMTIKKRKVSDHIYYLTIEDVQNVAQDLLGRDLSDDEIAGIENSIAENITWYDAIERAIVQTFRHGIKEKEQVW